MDKLPYETLEKMITNARQRTMGSRWRRYKGTEYIVKDIAVLEATNEIAIIYVSPEHPLVSFVRSLSIWSETVEWNGRQVPRFIKIDKVA